MNQSKNKIAFRTKCFGSPLIAYSDFSLQATFNRVSPCFFEIETMPINALPHPIARPPNVSSVTDTPVSGNTHASNPPVSERPAAFPPRSHQYGCMAFLQQTSLAQAFLLKYAKSFAEKDPTEFCRRFGTDATKLTEKSRTELARWFVEKAPWALAENIQKFEITDESIRIELAHRIAEEALHALASNIHNFAIADESTRIELAHKVAEKELVTLAANFQNFAIADERTRIELAYKIAEKKPGTLAGNIQKFAITDERIRVELAHKVVEKAPDMLAANIKNFAIANENIRIELAHKVAEKELRMLAWTIKNFAIANENIRIELAHKIAEKELRTLAEHIQDFVISNESTKIGLAKIVAEEYPEILVQRIQYFAISDESAKIELAYKIAEKEPKKLASHIQDFAISSESARIELAHKVAEKEPEKLASHIQNFAIANESAKIELAHKVAEKDSAALAFYIQNFAIADESARIGFAQILVRKCLSPSLVGIGSDAYLEKFEISNPSARANLYASVYLGLIAKGEMSATDKRLINTFFPGDPEILPLAQVAAQVASPPPVIAGLLTTAEQHPNPHIQETLSTWTQLVSLRFTAEQLPEAAWQELKAPLEAIQKWRAPSTRYALVHLLAQQCLPPEAGDVNGFFAFGKQFARPHTHLYPALLFPLFQSAPNDPTLERLVTLLRRSDFKDATRQKVMVDALLALAQADRLPDDLKRALLQAALPNGGGKEAARSLADTASAMQCLVSLAQNDPKLGDKVLQCLQSIRNPGDFNEQMNGVFKDLFPNLSNAQDVAAHFNRYREQARDPTGVLSYAAKLQNGLAGDEKASVLAAIDQFVNAAVLASEPEKAFRELRYNPAQSPHLRLLADKAPAAFAQWRQPCVYQPSAAFLAQTAGGAKQTDIAAYLKQRIVMDRHVPPGTYPLLEQVLAGQRTLASALQESKPPAASATGVEADLLRLLKGTPVEQKMALITQSLAALPQGQFRQDLTDLETLLTPSGRQANKQFTVIDTDAAEDLFLCGTEVLGSCQDIQGNPTLNKALMGYVLDGKYRMLAIKSADGRLMGRRMQRLLWDEQTQRPVLHLERLYHNPGIPEKYEQALVELAQQKARQMGCVLVSHDEALPSDGDYPAPLIAHPTPWPFEYVDAEGLRVRAGEEGYQLSEARIVASRY